MEIQRRDPGDILATPVPGHGWAYVRDLTRLYQVCGDITEIPTDEGKLDLATVLDLFSRRTPVQVPTTVRARARVLKWCRRPFLYRTDP